MLALLLAAACSGDCSAQKAFKRMEKALMQPARIEATIHSHADGALAAELDSSLSLGHTVLLHETGKMAGDPVNKEYEELTTIELRAKLLLGLTRIGLLHNLRKIAHNDPPGPDPKSIETHDFARAQGGVSFKIRVEGQDAGEATVLIDRKTHLPTSRSQTVHFPNGDMHVTESYQITASR
jgi:hypothetical protein